MTEFEWHQTRERLKRVMTIAYCEGRFEETGKPCAPEQLTPQDRDFIEAEIRRLYDPYKPEKFGDEPMSSRFDHLFAHLPPSPFNKK